MIFLKPWFYDEFKCIGSKCNDNCCIGWEIDVDEEALLKYDGMSDDFGKLIKKNLVDSADGSICFKLCKDERCAFLNKNNLCDIIINCGEDALCNICREHPRFYEWFPGVTECGLGLCCEEVCRLLVEGNDNFSLKECNNGEKLNVESKEDIVESDTYIFLSGFRGDIFKILSHDNMSFENKLVKILEKTENFTGEKIRLKNDTQLLTLYKKTEPINEAWTSYINDLDRNIDLIKAWATAEVFEKSNKLYSKILSYIVYRHFIKAVFDSAVSERIVFCIEAVRFLMLSDGMTLLQKGEITTLDRIENIKRWSKQIEYSEENTEILIFGE